MKSQAWCNFYLSLALALQIKIKLPDTEYNDVNLDVTDTFLDCRTPK